MRYSGGMEGEKPGITCPRIRRRFFVIGVVALLLAIGAGGIVLHRHTQVNRIPASIKNEVKFTTYYPATLPAGWSVDTTSYRVNDNVLFYAIKGPTTSVVVTIQQPPTSFSIHDFYKAQLTNVTQFDTPSGDGAIGTTGSRLAGSMLGNDSWVLLSPTSSGITQHTLKEILTALHP